MRTKCAAIAAEENPVPVFVGNTAKKTRCTRRQRVQHPSYPAARPGSVRGNLRLPTAFAPLFVAAAAILARAQVAATPGANAPASAPLNEPVIELSPFFTTAGSEEGYVATSSPLCDPSAACPTVAGIATARWLASCPGSTPGPNIPPVRPSLACRSAASATGSRTANSPPTARATLALKIRFPLHWFFVCAS